MKVSRVLRREKLTPSTHLYTQTSIPSLCQPGMAAMLLPVSAKPADASRGSRDKLNLLSSTLGSRYQSFGVAFPYPNSFPELCECPAGTAEWSSSPPTPALLPHLKSQRGWGLRRTLSLSVRAGPCPAPCTLWNQFRVHT